MMKQLDLRVSASHAGASDRDRGAADHVTKVNQFKKISDITKSPTVALALPQLLLHAATLESQAAAAVTVPVCQYGLHHDHSDRHGDTSR